MRQFSGKRDAFIERRRRSLIFCIYFRYSRALNGHFSSKIFIEITKAVVQDSILRTVSGVTHMENDLLFCSKLMFTNGNIVVCKYII